MAANPPPVYVIVPGRVFRRDTPGRDALADLPPGRGPRRRPGHDPRPTSRARSPPGARAVRRAARGAAALRLLPVHRAQRRGRRRVPVLHGRAAASARARAGSRSSAPAWSTRTCSSYVEGYDPDEVGGLRLRPRHRAHRDAAPRRPRHPRVLRQRPAASWSSSPREGARLLAARAASTCAPRRTSSPSASAVRARARGHRAPRRARRGRQPRRFRFGRVVEWGKHPNADRLRLCRVDVGEAEPRQIVCGAVELRRGRRRRGRAARRAALPGAAEPLRRAKLRGEVSDGMMLSERELQLSDEHDGHHRAARGARDRRLRAATTSRSSEVVLDLKVETNRGDCLSRLRRGARGRDALPHRPGAAAGPASPRRTGARPRRGRGPRRHRRPRPLPRASRPAPSHDVAPRRLAAVASRQRLAAAGMRPISNVVDVTNYVMLGIGQPLHAYDGATHPRRRADGAPRAARRDASPRSTAGARARRPTCW